MTTYRDRLEWFHELIEWFEDIDVDNHDVEVPNCPGWKVRDVVAHLAGGGAGWTAAQSHSPERIATVFAKGMARFPRARGVNLFPGAMRVLEAVLLSHDGDDPCNYYFAGPQCYNSYAQHAAAEIRLHQIDVQRALGAALTVSDVQATDGLEWSVDIALPSFAASLQESVPGASIAVNVEGAHGDLRLGAGDTVAEVSGHPVDVFLYLWDRGGDVVVDGDSEAARWWSTVSARAFQMPAST